MDKYQQVIADSRVTTSDAEVAAKVQEILDKHLDENRTPEVLKKLFSSIDLTTLKSTDSQQSVANFTERVNAFAHEYADLPNVAAICVYPNFVPVCAQFSNAATSTSRLWPAVSPAPRASSK